MNINHALAALLITLISGCSVGPDYSPPNITVGEHFRSLQNQEKSSAETKVKAESLPPLISWWQTFADPALSAMVERIPYQNLDYFRTQAIISETRARRAASASPLFPQIDASGTIRHSETAGGASGGISSPGGSVFIPQGQGSSSVRNVFQAGFDASWELDFFGQRRYELEATTALVDAATADLESLFVSLAAELSTQYFTYRTADERLKLLNLTLKAQEQTVKLIADRAGVGFASAVDLDNARSLANSTAAELPSALTERNDALENMALILRETPENLKLQIEASQIFPRFPERLLIGIPSELLKRRPDIKSAEARLKSAAARRGAAYAALFPKFSLTSSLSFQGDSFSSFSDGKNRVWSINPLTRLPIFNGGLLVGNLDAAAAIETQAEATYQKAVLSAFRDVETALVRVANDQDRLRRLEQAAENQKRATVGSRALFKEGNTDLLTLLVAERSLLNSQDSLLQARRFAVTDVASLYKSLGGGWEITSEVSADPND